MKLRVIYGSRLVRRKYGAWVMFPFMFFRGHRDEVTDALFRHEMEHVYQVLNDGWLVFYVKYLWWLCKHGYDKHPYELAARDAESKPLTTSERFFKDKQ